jgi:hypothetical protein
MFQSKNTQTKNSRRVRTHATQRGGGVSRTSIFRVYFTLGVFLEFFRIKTRDHTALVISTKLTLQPHNESRSHGLLVRRYS